MMTAEILNYSTGVTFEIIYCDEPRAQPIDFLDLYEILNIDPTTKVDISADPQNDKIAVRRNRQVEWINEPDADWFNVNQMPTKWRTVKIERAVLGITKPYWEEFFRMTRTGRRTTR